MWALSAFSRPDCLAPPGPSSWKGSLFKPTHISVKKVRGHPLPQTLGKKKHCLMFGASFYAQQAEVGWEGAAARHGVRPVSAASQPGTGLRTHSARGCCSVLPRHPRGRRGFSAGTMMATGRHSCSSPPSKRRTSGTARTSSGTTTSCLTRKSRGSRRSQNPK